MSQNTTTTAIDILASERSNPESLKSENKHFNGRWTKEEHQRFVEALKIHGKNWKKVEEYVATRSGAQIRSHAQKFFIRLEKDLKAEQGHQKGKNEKVKSIRKISESSISTHHTHDDALSDVEKLEDSLKENLPAYEVSDGFNESKKILVDNNTVNTEAMPMQNEKSDDTTTSKQAKSHLLSKISNGQKLKELNNSVKNIFTPCESKTANSTINNTATTTTTFRNPFSSTQLRPHQSVYLDLMNYFSQYNKTVGSLKLSDFVAFAGDNSDQDDANSYEFPVGGKKVKQC